MMRLKAFWLSAFALCLAGAAAVAEPEGGASTNTASQAQETNSQEMVRYLQLQEQLHATRLAIERDRQEAEAAAARNVEALANRLQTIEQVLASQRAQEFERMRSSNQTIVLVAAIMAGAGFLAILLLAYSHWRALNRMGEIAAKMSGEHWPLASRLALPSGGAPAERLALGPVEQSSSRLVGALERLEKRILELEQLPSSRSGADGSAGPDAGRRALGQTNDKSGPPAPLPADKGLPIAPQVGSTANGPKSVVSMAAEVTMRSDDKAESNSPVTALLAAGEEALRNDKAEEALASFEKALALQPDHAEAWVKKGTALERLRRLDEAIECYDRAIKADSSMTIAYLYKGGLFNRLERFSEALECYERALHSQSENSKKQAAQKP